MEVISDFIQNHWEFLVCVCVLTLTAEGCRWALKRGLRRRGMEDMLAKAEQAREERVIADLVTDAIIEAYLNNTIRKDRMPYYFRRFGNALNISDLMPGGEPPLKEVIRKRIALLRASPKPNLPGDKPDIIVLYDKDYGKPAKSYRNKLEEVFNRRKDLQEQRRMQTM